jgi:hypothetical protein
MRLKKTVTVILFLIIALMIFQLIPAEAAPADGFQIHTQNSKALLLSGFVHNDIIYIHNGNQKTSIQKVQINNTLLYVPPISVEGISVSSFLFFEMPFDHRKIIRQSIPHYFNGSKYKGNHTVV